MTPRIHTGRWFDHQAEEAARFHTLLFPRLRTTQAVRCGTGDPMPEGTAMRVGPELDGHALSLLNGGPHHHSPAASLVVSCADQAEVDRCRAALPAVPEAEMCGWLVDRFGVSWQIAPPFVLERMQEPPSPATFDHGDAADAPARHCRTGARLRRRTLNPHQRSA